MNNDDDVNKINKWRKREKESGNEKDLLIMIYIRVLL